MDGEEEVASKGDERGMERKRERKRRNGTKMKGNEENRKALSRSTIKENNRSIRNKDTWDNLIILTVDNQAEKKEIENKTRLMNKSA